ncbi:MAG: type I-U CRISPR-associated protein Cas5/Cas6 [Acidobacteria bacterium RIFCSPLOWO2_02_FULL_68_18]|nr:MAG: type I-U CRISPR-associated protein Cas5/Cas6 [Acidobacteria bacterium RIFCSPLOWO2_02_FULL_68_18]OFW48706.1 MAG: type I-U CRISPR-associated protein Cas5/Cas6 [Acidobacteria bacterium RIFCSPLOWO2_12_FULL_68_19]
MRLFQALVAGSRAGWRNGRWTGKDGNELRTAFEWLERREAPEIVAPEAHKGAAYKFFVPNNDSDQKFERQDRLTEKIVRPHRLATSVNDADRPHIIHYVWSIGDLEWSSSRPHAEVLCREARHLMALGWGIDQAAGDGQILTTAEAAALRGIRWRAWRGASPGRQCLRIPQAGSLSDCELVHTSFVNRVRIARRGRAAVLEYAPAEKLRCFDTVVYLPVGQMPPRHYAAFDLPDGVAFRQESTIEVAAMLRSLVCDDVRYRNRQDFSEQFPGVELDVYLAGHIANTPDRRKNQPQRFSYLPLPTIGHQHADGMIRRVLIAEPSGGHGAYARWADQRLRGQSLRDKDGHERGVLLDAWRRSSSGMLDRYVAQSTSWATVTPVILPGFDDFRGVRTNKREQPTKAERLFLKAVEQSGVPLEAVRDVTLRRAPFWPGSQHPASYRRPDYLDSPKNRRFSAWHACLTFREPVTGPLAIGAGRHIGLGLFAIWER